MVRHVDVRLADHIDGGEQAFTGNCDRARVAHASIRSMASGVIPVRYLQGYGGKVGPGELELSDAGVAFLRRRNRPEWTCTWDDVRSIHFDDPGRTKANGAAIFAFGVLGLASRRAFNIVTVDSEARGLGYLETEWPLGTWRAVLPQILRDVPAAQGKLLLQGDDLGGRSDAPAPEPASDPLEQLSRLAQLRDQGVVTAAEFEQKKAELLSRM